MYTQDTCYRANSKTRSQRMNDSFCFMHSFASRLARLRSPPSTSRSLQYIVRANVRAARWSKHTVPFVSRVTAENLNEISIHNEIRIANSATLKVRSSTRGKIDDVELLSALPSCGMPPLFNRIMCGNTQSLK